MRALGLCSLILGAVCVHAGVHPGRAQARVGTRRVVAAQVRLGQAPGNFALQAALQGSYARLGQPRCQQVFSDFGDESGRVLTSRLEELGESPQSYLGRIRFSDGSREPECERSVLAFTYPSASVVHVCTARLLETWRADAAYVEIVLIHELLHTLGLGENPPTSREITAQVAARCR